MPGQSVSEFVSMKKAVIFDLFHTLTDLESTWPDVPTTWEILGVGKEAWNEQWLEKRKGRLTGREKDPFKTIQNMAHAINPDIPGELIQKATDNKLFRSEGAVVNIPESVIGTLKTLKLMNKKLGLISNANVFEISGWNKSPIKDYFDSVVFSFNAGIVKPDKEIYERSLKELNEKPENAVFVGDGNSNELYGAKQAGMSTIMITGIIKEIWPDKIESRKANADYAIENIDELIKK
jgi:putative hydrolase of the HAD superfamily